MGQKYGFGVAKRYTVVFVYIAWQATREPTLAHARFILAGMLAVTLALFLISGYLISDDHLSSIERIVADLYSLLPFIMMAGLALFPLTLLELLGYAVRLILMMAYANFPSNAAEFYEVITAFWLFFLTIGVAFFSSVLQLSYLLSSVSCASYDALTGLLTRSAGIEILNLQFRVANLNKSSLSILFLDLDHFKTVNDEYGHDAGDAVLKNAARHLV